VSNRDERDSVLAVKGAICRAVAEPVIRQRGCARDGAGVDRRASRRINANVESPPTCQGIPSGDAPQAIGSDVRQGLPAISVISWVLREDVANGIR
jgi:hypothetical protein